MIRPENYNNNNTQYKKPYNTIFVCPSKTCTIFPILSENIDVYEEKIKKPWKKKRCSNERASILDEQSIIGLFDIKRAPRNRME